MLWACILGEPATAATVATLLGYEQIVCAAPVIVDERARRAAEQIWTAPANDARQSSAR